jgi:rubrerythrin
MQLSKEDIAEIAKVTAQAVIKAVREDKPIYHVPTSVQEGLEDSMEEELTASMWYQLRARHAAEHGFHDTAKLYNHIASEESLHYEELSKRLIEMPG